MRKANHTMTNDPVVINILKTLEFQGKTGKDMERALGLANGAVSKWKYLGLKSYRKNINEIAKYLNVTVEELEKEELVQSDSRMSVEEKRILEMYRKLNGHEREYFEQTLVYLSKISEFERMYSKNTIEMKKKQ